METIKNQFDLFYQRRFLPLFCTQFLGALNDSLFRNALIILLAFTSQNAVLNQDTLVNLGAALFVIPYFLFSALAGQLADKFEKSILIRFVKLAEVFLAALAILGFYLNSLLLLLISLFLLGTQATFFGPIKYSILPQHLQESELMAGNGLIEMGTFIAILLGTMFGSLLIAIPNTGLIWVSVFMGMAALMGLASSLFIPEAKPYVPNLKIDIHPLRETLIILKTLYKDRIVFHSVIGISWFWLYGSMFLTQTPNYTKLVLNGNEHVASILLITFSVGIGIGSLLCNRLSRQKVEMGLVPLGALGLSLFAFDLACANGSVPETTVGAFKFLIYKHNWRIIVDSFLMGIFGGFYLVPLYALIQKESPPEQRSRFIAANNILNALFMTAASVIAIVVLNLGFSIPHLYLLTSLLNLAVAIYIFKRVPEFLMRFLVWLLIHSIYFVSRENLKQIPNQGPALLVCTQKSFWDPLILIAVSSRPLRVVIHSKELKKPLLNFIYKTAHAISIGKEYPIPEIISALKREQVVAVFSEKNTFMEEDIEEMTADLTVPIIPIKIERIHKRYLNISTEPMVLTSL